MKVLSGVLFIAIILRIICDDKIQSIYIKGVRCNVTEVAYSNFSCFGKSYNRSFSTLNIFIWLKRPFMKIEFEARLFYKYGTIYREVMHTPRVDWCQLVKDSYSNMMLKHLMTVFKESAPTILHDCPYETILVKDCYAKAGSLPSLFPAGDYKMILYFFEDGICNVVINMIGTMISPLKESFG